MLEVSEDGKQIKHVPEVKYLGFNLNESGIGWIIGRLEKIGKLVECYKYYQVTCGTRCLRLECARVQPEDHLVPV